MWHTDLRDQLRVHVEWQDCSAIGVSPGHRVHTLHLVRTGRAASQIQLPLDPLALASVCLIQLAVGLLRYER